MQWNHYPQHLSTITITSKFILCCKNSLFVWPAFPPFNHLTACILLKLQPAECVKAVCNLKWFFFLKSSQSYIINNICLTIYLWIYLSKRDRGVVEMRDVQWEWASKANKDRWCVEQRRRQEEEKTGSEAWRNGRRRTRWREKKKAVWKKTLVIAPAVCVNRDDAAALALSFCVRLSVSLILLTKHVVSWMLGLGPKPACWAWEEHRVIDMGDYLLLWSCLTLHPHYLTSQDWDCWQAHTQTQQLYTCFTSGASVCLGLRSSKAYLTHQKPSQIGLISS